MLIAIIIIGLILELIFRPRLGFTSEGKILLWHGRRKRNYIVII